MATAEYRALADQARKQMEEEELAAQLALEAAQLAEQEALAAAAAEEDWGGDHPEWEDEPPAWDERDGGYKPPARLHATRAALAAKAQSIIDSLASDLAAKLQRSAALAPPLPPKRGRRGDAADGALALAPSGAAAAAGQELLPPQTLEAFAAQQLTVQPPPNQPWNPLWDSLLCNVVNFAVAQGFEQQPLVSLAWDVLANFVREGLKNMGQMPFTKETLNAGLCLVSFVTRFCMHAARQLRRVRLHPCTHGYELGCSCLP